MQTALTGSHGFSSGRVLGVGVAATGRKPAGRPLQSVISVTRLGCWLVSTARGQGCYWWCRQVWLCHWAADTAARAGSWPPPRRAPTPAAPASSPPRPGDSVRWQPQQPPACPNILNITIVFPMASNCFLIPMQKYP